MASSPVLRAAFIIISTTIILYTTSEAYLIRYRPPYGNIYLQAVREILKRQADQTGINNHIPPEAVDFGETLQLPNKTEDEYGRDMKRGYSLATLKLDKVKDIHLKVDVFELDNELPPANTNK